MAEVSIVKIVNINHAIFVFKFLIVSFVLLPINLDKKFPSILKQGIF
jgi:hypothetical protein